MSTISFHKFNESKVKVTSPDSGALMELSEHFTFFVDGYKFMPAFRNKMWDGKLRLFNYRDQTLPFGLIPTACAFLKKRGYTFSFEDNMFAQRPSKKEVKAYIDSLVVTDGDGNEIRPRDYQEEAIIHSLSEGRSLTLSPTGSGKSLIIYTMMRWFLDHGPENQKVLIVVPTTSLVAQMAGDFDEYSSKDDEFFGSDVHQIMGGREKNDDKMVYVSTWQSIFKMPKGYFAQFGMIIGDEAHLSKAKSLGTIMDNLVNASYRIGTTGTLDGATVNERVLIGHYGPVYNVISTKKLMDDSVLSAMEIKCMHFRYPEGERKIVSKLDYKSEIDVIVEYEKRNTAIIDIANKTEGNTLILFNFVEKHGKPLYARLCEESKKKVYYISGETKTEEREEIRKRMELEEDVILIASVATLSTGVNIKNLHNLVFAAPIKSQVKVLQSIGRILRKSKDGRPALVFDIADDFSWKKSKNFALKHAIHRAQLYAKGGFKFSTEIVDI